MSILPIKSGSYTRNDPSTAPGPFLMRSRDFKKDQKDPMVNKYTRIPAFKIEINNSLKFINNDDFACFLIAFHFAKFCSKLTRSGDFVQK